VTAGAIAAHPSASASASGPVTDAPLIGEHSALGAQRVDSLNATIAAMGAVRGEHAGLSSAEYQAGAALDGTPVGQTPVVNEATGLGTGNRPLTPTEQNAGETPRSAAGARGEHAGLSQAEYKANAGLDGPIH
jgi:hypothetical protein